MIHLLHLHHEHLVLGIILFVWAVSIIGLAIAIARAPLVDDERDL